MKKLFLQTSILGLGLLVTACASTATGSRHSAVLLKAPAETLQTQVPKGSALTIIRYPAVVETAAHDAYLKAYLSTPIGGRVSAAVQGAPEAASIADGVIVKSNYFALSLYKELVKRLPEHSVLLSPHAIKLGKNGQLVSEPITKAENLGAATYIDFVSYSFPDPAKMMGGVPLTFGDLITPLLVVRSDHRAAPASEGVILASDPLVRAAGGQGRAAAYASMRAIENGEIKSDTPELAFVSYLTHKEAKTLPGARIGNGIIRNAAQVYPVEKILLDREALARIGTKNGADIDPLETAFSSAFADRLVAVLNDTDMDKAVMMGRAAAVSAFDPSLAALTVGGSGKADYQSRLRYAERLLEAEKKYLSVQSLRIYDGVYNGEMGAQVRDMLKAEYEVLQKRRSLARKQNIATGLTVLAAVAAGAAISNSSNNAGGVSYSDILLNEALINATMYAGQQIFSYKRRSAAIGKNYLASIVPAIDDQISVQLNLIDSNETITAIRFEDLQAKLHGLYQKNQRSLDVAATRCLFKAAAEDVKGAWFGECKNGRAGGDGMGVLRLSAGVSAEYFGQSKDGLADGVGYMIYHTPKESYSVEGRFVAGRPTGPVRVSKPGQPDEMRLYQNGVDAGPAPAGAKIASPFDTAELMRVARKL